ncbi:hypothetical protein AAFF_G00090300 [Aldrovandia affinis]|uniref:Uncharacterized protein n=1 Tax=Aldrovandia affinis TaxID=143900 RepID=A0AAD7RW87_9TELE|nr:hypothetical protein AAFF_G00090300 [Aldrovandia affinis]
MPQLQAPPEAVLPQLRGIEKRLTKTPGQAAAYQLEIHKLEEAGYAVKLEPHRVENTEQAYGSVAYLRTESPEGEVDVSFLAARSRIAPKKQQSFPRLERCAALTCAQLSKVIATELTLPIRSLTLWSDSMTVLTWLLSDLCRYKVFVGTRVEEVQELTESATCRYVPSGDNPADDITRGLALRDLSEGPQVDPRPSIPEAAIGGVAWTPLLIPQ